METEIIKTTNALILYPETDFTTVRLVDFLNDKYQFKKTGEKFTLNDIQQYLIRGFLPKRYGHHPIARIENEEIGVKLVRVYFDKTIK